MPLAVPEALVYGIPKGVAKEVVSPCLFAFHFDVDDVDIVAVPAVLREERAESVPSGRSIGPENRCKTRLSLVPSDGSAAHLPVSWGC